MSWLNLSCENPVIIFSKKRDNDFSLEMYVRLHIHYISNSEMLHSGHMTYYVKCFIQQFEFFCIKFNYLAFLISICFEMSFLLTVW